MTHKPFSYGKILAIGSGFLALTLVWTLYNTYMPLILGDFMESRFLRGAIMGLDNLLAVILIPVIGTWSDRVNSRYGKRLPFILLGMPLAALFFILLPLSAVTIWILLIIDICFLLSMTIYRAPVISLMPDHTPSEKRSTANGIINFMGGIGALSALFALAPLYDLSRNYPFIIGGIMLVLTTVLLYLVIDRNPPYVSSVEETEEMMAVKAVKSTGTKQLVSDIRGHLLILLAIFFYFIGYSGVEAQFSVYATETLGVTGGEAGLALGFFSLSFVLFALPAGLIGTKMGKSPAMLVGLVMLPLIFIFIPLFDSLTTVKVLLFAGGFAWALINVQAYPLVADLGGKTKIGFFTGLYYLFSSFSSIVAPALVGLGMDLLGNRSLFYTAAVSFVIAFFLLRRGIKSSGKY